MRIATYNIWNNDRDFHTRLELLAKVIKEFDIDIAAFQEVRDERVVKFISDETGMPYYCWQAYPDCEEGLAIISRHQIDYKWNNWSEGQDFHNSGVINASISVDGIKVGITNIHLDYKRALFREIEIVETVKKIEKSNQNDYEFILGDFNTYPCSSVHTYLIGGQSLREHSTSFIDLYDSFAARTDYSKASTLDFYNNPRWDNEYVLDVPGRFDWIMLMNPYPKACPKLMEYKVIGDERLNGITPSDHYGVLCELKL